MACVQLPFMTKHRHGVVLHRAVHLLLVSQLVEDSDLACSPALRSLICLSIYKSHVTTAASRATYPAQRKLQDPATFIQPCVVCPLRPGVAFVRCIVSVQIRSAPAGSPRVSAGLPYASRPVFKFCRCRLSGDRSAPFSSTFTFRKP